jgi:hypothetical protein
MSRRCFLGMGRVAIGTRAGETGKHFVSAGKSERGASASPGWAGTCLALARTRGGLLGKCVGLRGKYLGVYGKYVGVYGKCWAHAGIFQRDTGKCDAHKCACVALPFA